MPSYRPFLVRIGQPADGAYPVAVEFQGLEAHTSIPEEALRQCLADASTVSRDQCAQLGSRLFNAVFTGEVLRLYNTAQDWLGPQEHLRIILAQPLPDPLGRLPWELIFDAPERPRSLAATHNTPLVRHAPSTALPHGPPQRGALRVLVVTAFPPGVLSEDAQPEALARHLPLRDVLRRLGRDLQTGGLKDTARWFLTGRRYHVTLLEAPTRTALARLVAEAEARGVGFHVIHFLGQATSGGEFLLPSGNMGWLPVAPAELVRSCLTASVTVFAVTLCQPDSPGETILCTAEEATRQGVPAVIGMHVPQLDAAVIDFSREFYRALSVGEPLELAVAYGRKLVAQLHDDESSPPLPALYVSHTGGLALPSLQLANSIPAVWRWGSGVLATVLTLVATATGILDLPNFPRMLRERAPLLRCVLPNEMDANKLTIAFQPFTVVDGNGGSKDNRQGRAVSQFLYERFKPALADLKLTMPYELRGPSLACALSGRTAEDRAQAAAALADRINADILVYGVITDTAKTDRVSLAFQVNQRGFENEEALAGAYALGGSLPITLPFDPEPLLAIDHPPHLVRMNVLAEMVVGLSYLAVDNPEKAAGYLLRTTEDPHWPNADGKELAQVLYGHALMRLASITEKAEPLGEALSAYEKAIAINPSYIRAYLGRAAALSMLAQPPMGEKDGRLDDARLAEAAEAYGELLVPQAFQLTPRQVASVHIGLGYVYLVGKGFGRLEDGMRCKRELSGVLTQYEAGDPAVTKKMAGTTHGYLGLLALTESDASTARFHLERAVEMAPPVSRARFLYYLAQIACNGGDRQEATRLYNAAADEARMVGRADEVDEYVSLLSQLRLDYCP